MAYQQFADGLYLVKQFLPRKGVDHYGVLDAGNRIQHPSIQPGQAPVVIHQPPPALRLDWFHATGPWELVGRIVDEAGARARIEAAAKTPNYDLFGNNCEHFARFVATGERTSPQLVMAVGIVLGVAALAWVVSDAGA